MAVQGRPGFCPILKQVLWDEALIIVNDPGGQDEDWGEPASFRDYLEGVRGNMSPFDPHS